MEIKCKKSLKDFQYLVMFDLASKITGVCLWNIEKHAPENTTIIHVNSGELPCAELYNLIDKYFQDLLDQGINLSKVLVSFEAAPSQLSPGRGSTIQTFIALARSHAILDLYTYQHNLATYDYVGVHPITTHAYFKKLCLLERDAKVTKEDIRDYVISKYGIVSDLSLDESDAIFLAQTLLESKWNKDLEEAIREEKRHLKALKAQHAIKSCNEEIERLESLKIYKDK